MKFFFPQRAAAAALALALACCALPTAAWADAPASAPAAVSGDASVSTPAGTGETVPGTEVPPAETPAAIPAPAVLLSRGEMPAIAAGSEADVTLHFQNLGQTALVTPVVTITPSEGLTLLGTASSFALSDIPAQSTGSVTVRLRAAAGAAEGQSLSAELHFIYDTGAGLAQGTASDRLSVPVTPRPAATQPLILVSRSALANPVSPGETFTVRLSFQNQGSVTATGLAAAVSASEGLTLLNETATLALADLRPGATATADLRLCAAKEIASESQSVSVDLRFSYDNAGTPTAASQSERVNIPAKATAASSTAQKTDAPVPNLVVSTFTYGDKDAKSVAAGGKFPLAFTFENTGSLTCENIVVTVDGGENFTVDGDTNTVHYKQLRAGKSQTQTMNMQAIPAAKSGAQPITVSFKYEYVDAGRRAAVTSDVRLTVPVSQPDRFQITPPTGAPELEEATEGELMFSYVNKGKAEIANLEAELVGEGFTSPARTQYLGNVAAGSSGNIGFALTPDTAGTLKLTVKITYEDADQQIQTREFPLEATVTEMPVSEDAFAPEEPEPAAFPWVPVVLGLAALAAAGAGLWLLRRKRKAGVPEDAAAWSWDESQTDLAAPETDPTLSGAAEPEPTTIFSAPDGTAPDATVWGRHSGEE